MRLLEIEIADIGTQKQRQRAMPRFLAEFREPDEVISGERLDS
jgi:hypothetical protein